MNLISSVFTKNPLPEVFNENKYYSSLRHIHCWRGIVMSHVHFRTAFAFYFQTHLSGISITMLQKKQKQKMYSPIIYLTAHSCVTITPTNKWNMRIHLLCPFSIKINCDFGFYDNHFLFKNSFTSKEVLKPCCSLLCKWNFRVCIIYYLIYRYSASLTYLWD